MSLSSALKYSINTAAARLIMEHTSTEDVIKLAKEMGIKSPIPNVPSIALGTAELTPLEITAAFGTFPNNGVFVEPTMITRVEDRYGNVVYEAPRIVHDALDPKPSGAFGLVHHARTCEMAGEFRMVGNVVAVREDHEREPAKAFDFPDQRRREAGRIDQDIAAVLG